MLVVYQVQLLIYTGQNTCDGVESHCCLLSFLHETNYHGNFSVGIREIMFSPENKFTRRDAGCLKTQNTGTVTSTRSRILFTMLPGDFESFPEQFYSYLQECEC